MCVHTKTCGLTYTYTDHDISLYCVYSLISYIVNGITHHICYIHKCKGDMITKVTIVVK